MLFLTSTVFHICLALWTTTICSLFIPTLFTGNTKIVASIGGIWSRVVFAMLKFFCRVDYEITGIENIPKYPCIIACKHQSMWDPFFLIKLISRPVFIIKRELTRVPIFGWYLVWMGMICIDRSTGIAALKEVIFKTKIAFGQNRSLIIFPEGTRSKMGETLKIQPGVIAIHNALPEQMIIPIALDSGKLWPKGSWLIRPGTVKVKVGKPIVAASLDKKEFLQRISTEINKLNS